MQPIWKDYFVTLGATGPVDYRVRLNDAAGDIIYNGRAYLRPDADSVIVRINDIAADYFAGTLPALSQAVFEEQAVDVTLYVEYYDTDEEDWVEADTVQFLNDWSYDPSFDVDTMGLSHPINGRIDARQWIVYTAVGASDVTMTIHFSDGQTTEVIVPIEVSADFNDDFNNDFTRTVDRGPSSGTAVFNIMAWSDVDYITIGLARYTVVTDCGKYALYYRNAYGGWDTFLLEGQCRRTDRLVRHEQAHEYDNRSLQNRGVANYLNEVTPVWEISTGILDDAAGEMMHHVLESTDVFLYEIDTDRMIPVVLEGEEAQWQTYKSNGRQPVRYTFTARLARKRVRR